jgi:hypothetical protein
MASQANVKTETPLLELADRCEKAAGPDRLIGAQIHTAVWQQSCSFNSKWDCWETAGGSRIPLYTASIDAALILVPEGRRWLLQTLMTGKYRAEVDWNGHGQGTTPAIALCAAALRARDAVSPTQKG